MIVDCVMAGYRADIDMLVCRMTELDSVVDRFVIVDSPRTFGGQPKPSWVEQGLGRLMPWEAKTVWINGSNDPLPEHPRHHEYDAREIAQGELYRHALTDLEPDDIILIGAADEIPRVQEFRPGTVLQMRQHVYDLQTVCRITGAPWNTSVIRYGDLDPDRPIVEQLYHHRYKWPIVPDAGWHLTYFGGPDAVKEKLLALIPGRDVAEWVWAFQPLYDYEGHDWPRWAADAPPVWWDACPYGLRVRDGDSRRSTQA